MMMNKMDRRPCLFFGGSKGELGHPRRLVYGTRTYYGDIAVQVIIPWEKPPSLM